MSELCESSGLCFEESQYLRPYFAVFILGLRQSNNHSISSSSASVSSAYHLCSFCIFFWDFISCGILDLIFSQPPAGLLHCFLPLSPYFVNELDQDACSKLRCSPSQRDLSLHQRAKSGCNGRHRRFDCKLRGRNQQCWH